MSIIWHCYLRVSLKKATFKVYDIVERQNYPRVLELFKAFKENMKPHILYCREFSDYDDHVGFHFNMVLKSSSYKTLQTYYSHKGDLKTSGVYLWLHEIESTDMFIDWVCYCNMREQTNFKRKYHLEETKVYDPPSPQLLTVQFEN